MKKIITKESFEIVKKFSNYHLDLINKLQNDRGFINAIYHSTNIKEETFGSEESMFDYLFVLDLMKCFSIISDISDFNSIEAFALLFTMSKKYGFELEDYNNHHLIYDTELILKFKSVYNSIKDTLHLDVKQNETFRLSMALSMYDKKLQGAYLSSLYRFSHIVANIDGKITPNEELALKKILDLTSENHPNNENFENKIDDGLSESFKKDLETSINELNELIGLSSVKNQIISLINYLKVQNLRKEEGLKISTLNYHIVFTGNPGTGKTTVARLLANIYKNLGVLQKGHFIETDRSGLVGEYLGQTAIKVNKLVDEALDGILFIDEAYSLINSEQDSYGKEAVSTLIKRMEDDRSRIIIILAGYSTEIELFLNTNPGLKSRFNRFIDFVDYTPDELLQIFDSMCVKLDYKLSSDGRTNLNTFITKSYSNRTENFANGRFVRNLFEKVLENHANRIANELEIDSHNLITISQKDIPEG